jgi:hypothetical protein
MPFGVPHEQLVPRWPTLALDLEPPCPISCHGMTDANLDHGCALLRGIKRRNCVTRRRFIVGQLGPDRVLGSRQPNPPWGQRLSSAPHWRRSNRIKKKIDFALFSGIALRPPGSEASNFPEANRQSRDLLRRGSGVLFVSTKHAKEDLSCVRVPPHKAHQTNAEIVPMASFPP